MQVPTSNIIILSRPIRSGKTTELFEYVAGKRNIGGILTPDKDGKRRMYDIATQIYHEFEVEPDSAAKSLSIGHFRFAITAFDKAKHTFRNATRTGLFILDEVGKLEIMHNIGFEPELSELIREYETQEAKSLLLLVVRETLLEATLNKFGLGKVRIINSIAQL